MDVSSTCMNVAIEITIATSHGLRPPAAERLITALSRITLIAL
jgi:hypothetical protein